MYKVSHPFAASTALRMAYLFYKKVSRYFEYKEAKETEVCLRLGYR